MPAQLSTTATQENFLFNEGKALTTVVQTPTKLASTVDILPNVVSPDFDSDVSSPTSMSGSNSTSDDSMDRSQSSDDLISSKVTLSDHRILERDGKLEPEPMLIENKRRFVLFPIVHDDVSRLQLLFSFSNQIQNI